jgi:spermidine/putrescine transport system ATP-binding protein
VNEPKLLLLDEPMSALDAKLRRQMQIELKRIQEQVGITFLYVTHDQEEAMTMSDRLAVMRKGRIEGIGEPRDVYESPSTEFVASFLGASNLLTGLVTSNDGQVASVKLDDATTLRVPLKRIPDLEGALNVRVGVRPEKISIGALGTTKSVGENSIRGRVRVSTFTGVGNQYLVDTSSGVEMTVYAQNIGQDSAPRSGQDVELTWPVEHTFAVRPMESDSRVNLEDKEE